jgi:4-hydroxythreonine-4-phosphate dehydrogenase
LPYQVVVVADPGLLLQRARALGLPLELLNFSPSAGAQPQAAGSLQIVPGDPGGGVRGPAISTRPMAAMC